MPINIAKTTTLYEAPAGSNLSEVGGSFSDLSLFVFFKEDETLKTKALFKTEMVNADGIYQGSLTSGRWSPPTTLTNGDNDASPALVMRSDGLEPALLLWEREGRLYSAPSRITEGFISTQVNSDGSFNASMANPNGLYSKSGSELAGFFSNEKMAALYQGYDGDLVRLATAQADARKAYRDPDKATFSPDFKNKYQDLIGLSMSKRYGRIFPTDGGSTLITGYAPSAPIAAGATIELKIDAPAPARWYPGSVKIANMTNAANLTVTGPYGQSEAMAFLRITNNGTAAVTPTMDIVAVSCSDLAEKVDSATLTIGSGGTSQDQYYQFADTSVKCDPVSYQINVIEVSGGGVSSLAQYKSTYHPQHVIFDPTVDGTGVQILLYDANGNPKGAAGTINIAFEIWARRMKKKEDDSGKYVVANFGRFWTAKEVLFDLAKLASRKELKLGESDSLPEDDQKKLAAGQFTKHVFITIEEEFDVETLRVVNTGDGNLNMSILDAGFIYDDDGNQVWGARVAVARGQISLAEQDFLFQLWGQYPERTDFFYPFEIAVPDDLDINVAGELIIVDTTIEDTINKILQVSFDGQGNKYKMFYDSGGKAALRAYRTNTPVATITVRNMQEITNTQESPTVVDRIAVNGQTSEAYLQSESVEELIHDQTADAIVVPAGSKHYNMTIQFDGSYMKDSLRLEQTWSDRGHVELMTRAMTYCVVRLHNDSWNNLQSGKARFRLYGKELNTVKYQDSFTYKTPPGTSGKYSHVEAEVNNELISSAELASLVGDSMVLESANTQQYFDTPNMPANPAIQKYDTIYIFAQEEGAYHRAIVEDISFVLDGDSDAPEYLMTIKARPFDRFITGSFSGDIEADGDAELDGDLELDGDANVSVLLNLIFG